MLSRPTGAVAMRSTAQSILHWATATPDAIAVSKSIHRFTYADLATRIVRFTAAFVAAGVQPGMVVGIECPDRYLHLVLLLACETLGATTTSFAPADIDAGNELVTACNLICAHTQADILLARSDVLWLTDETVNHILLSDVGDLATLDTGWMSDAVGSLIRTSGTTSTPKIIPLSYAVIAARTELHAQALQADRFDGQLILVHDLRLPLALVLVRAALALGRTIRFSAFQTLADDARTPDGSFLLLNSGAAQFILAAHASGTWSNRTHRILFTGAHLPQAVLERIKRTAAPLAFSSYGATEVGTIARSYDGLSGHLHPGVQVRIADDSGAVLPPGYMGSIGVRSPQAISHYLGNPDLSLRQFKDGWFQTGDLGFIDNVGRLVVIGRSDDILNIGGEKFHPGPVEAEIRSNLGAGEIVLVSLPDASGFDQLCVAIEGTPSAVDTSELPGIISAALQPHLSSPGVAFRIVHVNAFPRTDTGKIRRRDLRRLLLGQEAPLG